MLMSTFDASGQRRRTDHLPWASIISLLAAAGLFMGSALLQLIASLQRWVVFSGSRQLGDISAEDHLFDYYFPFDPWVPVGTAAQLFGIGALIQALGVLVMAVGVATLPNVSERHRGIAAIMVSVEIALAVLVAAWFGLHGAHALASGTSGTPSSLQHLFLLGFVSTDALIALAVLWRNKLWAASVACVFLIGLSLAGYLLATYVIAPLFAGSSHDTAPWTETVVAASTAAAGIAMLFASGRLVAGRLHNR